MGVKLLIILGSLIWSLTMIKSGWIYDYGMGFWGPNGHDGVWHIALANGLARSSLEMPIFAGEQIKNYHIGFDLFLAALHKITTIPTHNLYFQILPPLFALTIGILVWKLTNSFWSVFFIYFGGNWAWILGKGESTLWAQQAISTLINPPFALSLILLFAGMLCLKHKKDFWAVIFFSLLPQVKIYGGILALAALLINKNYKVFIFSVILSALLFLPLNTGAQKLIEWRPGWFLETLFAPDRLDWPKFFSALNTYRSGSILIKGMLAYTVALTIFLVGNFGTRLIGLFKANDRFSLTIIILGIIFPMLFVQKGTTWNTIQFFYYSQVFLGLSAGLVMTKWPKWLNILIMLVTIPTTIDTMKHYLPSRPPAMVSKSELVSLENLKKLPMGIVLTRPVTKSAGLEPRPLYIYESTAYVSAFTNKPVYMEDEVNLNITGFDWQERRQEMSDYFTQPTLDFLIKHNIKYVYSNGAINITN